MESKCPCCGSEISDFEESGFWECEECPFMCALADLPRIATAMELAKVLVEQEPPGWEKRARICASTRQYNAERRVLEVFGGE